MGVNDTIKTVNSTLRTLLALVVVGGAGYAGYIGYAIFNEPQLRLAEKQEELAKALGEIKARDAKVGELNDKLAAVYWNIFRRTSEAAMGSDAAALAEVLKLLEFERETWQKVCEQFGVGPAPNSSTVPIAAHVFSANASTTGISLQA